MKIRRRISRSVQTCLSLWNSSRHNSLKGFFVHLNRLSFIRILCLRPAQGFPLVAQF
jgi:hypothetical protein